MIRPATLEDLDAIISIGKVMHEESRYSVFQFDETIARESVSSYLEQDFVDIAYVAESDGKVVGCILGRIIRNFFGPEAIAIDRMTYVLPEYRGKSLGVGLIKKYIQTAKEKGAVEVRFGVSSGIDDDRVVKILEHHGFETVSTNMGLM